MGQSGSINMICDQRPDTRNDAAGELRGEFQANLLPKHGSQRDLESSQPPGTRKPGRAETSGAMTGSTDKTDAMATGSALKSNIRRTRAMITGRRLRRGKRTATRRAHWSGAWLTVIEPTASRSSMTRL